jgi:hypothetical protein
LEFEREFTYPLGHGCRFRISHGEDYLGFFRSMGEATLVVTEDMGRITGSIARVQKRLRNGTGGSVVEIAAHYLCDLKVRADCRGTLVLPRLIRETKRQIEASESLACYSVVMSGTGRLPTDYTGRLGVPKFEKLADMTILRLAAGDSGMKSMTSRIVSPLEILAVHEGIELSGYQSAVQGLPGRSLSTPVHLVAGNGDACGTLEDTRRVKRLFLDSGEELITAHLAGFRYKTPRAGGLFLAEAVEFARSAGFPAVFTAVPSCRIESLRPYLGCLDVTEAPAMVYGVGLESGAEWWLDTSEI